VNVERSKNEVSVVVNDGEKTLQGTALPFVNRAGADGRLHGSRT